MNKLHNYIKYCQYFNIIAIVILVLSIIIEYDIELVKRVTTAMVVVNISLAIVIGIYRVHKSNKSEGE